MLDVYSFVSIKQLLNSSNTGISEDAMHSSWKTSPWTPTDSTITWLMWWCNLEQEVSSSYGGRWSLETNVGLCVVRSSYLKYTNLLRSVCKNLDNPNTDSDIIILSIRFTSYPLGGCWKQISMGMICDTNCYPKKLTDRAVGSRPISSTNTNTIPYTDTILWTVIQTNSYSGR